MAHNLVAIISNFTELTKTTRKQGIYTFLVGSKNSRLHNHLAIMTINYIGFHITCQNPTICKSLWLTQIFLWVQAVIKQATPKCPMLHIFTDFFQNVGRWVVRGGCNLAWNSGPIGPCIDMSAS